MHLLKSKRLSIDYLSLQDAHFILNLLNTPGWLKFIGDRDVKTLTQAENYLKNGPLKSYSENGFGLYKVSLLNGTAIGICGIIHREGLEHPDLGFAILPEYAGKGYINEASEAVLEYAYSSLKLSIIYAIATTDNHSSNGLLKKLGFILLKNMYLPDDPKELHLYELRRSSEEK